MSRRTGTLGPNESLIGKAGSRSALNTPNLVVDLDVLERNIEALAKRAAAAGVQLRPHAKAHKSPEIARLQIAAGAIGVCCATVREAEELAGAGVPSCLITSPAPGSAKIARVADLHLRTPGLIVVADDVENVVELGQAIRNRAGGHPLGVVVDLDIGMHRTGVPNVASAVRLAQIIDRTEGLFFAGLQAYSGRDQHLASFEERRSTYDARMQVLRDCITEFGRAGLNPTIVTGGGTGTFELDLQNKLFTEIQPGSYIFMDVQYGGVELLPGQVGFDVFGVSLFVQTTVVSVNPVQTEHWVVTDGGYKSFATDGPFPQLARGAPSGATYTFFGDEHGRVILPDPTNYPALGDIVECISPHCDPTVNLHSFYHCVRKDELVAIWPIPARGVL